MLPNRCSLRRLVLGPNRHSGARSFQFGLTSAPVARTACRSCAGRTSARAHHRDSRLSLALHHGGSGHMKRLRSEHCSRACCRESSAARCSARRGYSSRLLRVVGGIAWSVAVFTKRATKGNLAALSRFIKPTGLGDQQNQFSQCIAD
jgi:hypothetical protein